MRRSALGTVVLLLAGCFPSLTAQLAAPTHLYAGRDPVTSVPADVNGDGKLDLITVRSWGQGEITVRLGNGDGTFATSIRIPGGDIAPRSPAVADLDGDGKVDLAVVGLTNGAMVSVLRGNGDGTFAEPVQHLIGASATSVKAGDFNGDGKMDLVVANIRPQASPVSEEVAGKLVILLGRGDGSFEAPRMFDIEGTPVAIQTGDWNGDGKLDVVLLRSDQNRREAWFLRGKGDGGFAAADIIAVPFTPMGLAPPADLNGDGKADLVIGVTSGVSVFLGNGSGFVHSADYATERTRSAWIADFNHDGHLDIATGRRLLLGDGTGLFQISSLPHPDEDDSFVAAGDFNGDGWTDLAATDMNHNEILIYLNRGKHLTAAR